MVSRTEWLLLNGWSLKTRRIVPPFSKEKKIHRGADAERFEILVKSRLGASYGFRVLDEVEDLSLNCICV